MSKRCEKNLQKDNKVHIYIQGRFLPGTQLYSASKNDINSLGHGCIFCNVSS